MPRPLEVLTGKSTVLLRNTEHQETFEKLYNALLTASVLQIADTSRLFGIVLDASDKAVEGDLLGHDVFYLCFSSSARIDFSLWREKKTKKFKENASLWTSSRGQVRPRQAQGKFVSQSCSWQ